MQHRWIYVVCLGLVSSVAAAQPGEPAPPVAPAPTEPPVPPPPPPPPVVEVKAPEPKPDVPKTEDKEKKPAATKLDIGKEGQGRWQPGMLAQGWFLLDRSGGKTTVSTFRLRRMELAVKGEILPKRVGFNMMIDPAKVREPVNAIVTDSGGNTETVKVPAASLSAVQDFYITGYSKYVEVSLGQFKIPVSWEGYNSSAKLMFPERALVSTTYGDKRDLGMRFTKTFKQWMYSAGIFNGQGANNLDTNVQKDVALRLEVYPVPGLTLAGVTYDSIGIRNRAGTKDRWEGDVRYEQGPLLLQGEFIEARDKGKDNVPFTKARGFYAGAGYTIKDKDKKLCGDLQPVVRVGYLDPDTTQNLDPTMAGGSDEVWQYDVGLNYYLKGHEMKLQGVYSRLQYDDKAAVNEVIVAAQVWY
jgi:hypothetical protein